METIADGAQEELEVVDFSDMGKFVGVAESVEKAPEPAQEEMSAASILSKSSRPSASDFFDDPVLMDESSMSESKKADFGAWRRKVSQDVPAPTPKQQSTIDEPKKADVSQELEADVSFSSESSTTKEVLGHLDHIQGQTVHVPSHNGSQRTPRTQTFSKEATISSLDDAMSRIKGVLNGMQDGKDVHQASPLNHTTQSTRTVHLPHPPQAPLRPFKDRRMPHSLRAPTFDDHEEPREVFLVTVLEPPTSPPPTGAAIPVRFPPISHPVDFIPNRQMYAFRKPPSLPHWGILSFDPPVPGMDRKTWSVNEVLFRNSPASFKGGRFKYPVVLPRGRGPRVQMPSGTVPKSNHLGAFGRPTLADGASSWRKPVSSTPISSDAVEEPLLENGFNPTSRSPPPDVPPAPQATVASIPKMSENSPTKSDASATRSRSQPKMPEGSAVAFRRDSRIDVFESDSKPRVNFIVGSELEEPTQSVAVMAETSRVVPIPTLPKSENAEPVKSGVNGIELPLPEFGQAKADSKDSDDSVSSGPSFSCSPLTCLRRSRSRMF